MDLDGIDKQIISLLQHNARLTYSQIGEAVGLSRVAVKNRIQALEDKNIITGYHAAVNLLAEDDTVTFYVYIETESDMYDTVSERLKNEPTVNLLLHLSGTNAMLLVCVAHSKLERTDFVRKVRTFYQGITHFTTRDIWEVAKGILREEHE